MLLYGKCVVITAASQSLVVVRWVAQRLLANAYSLMRPCRRSHLMRAHENPILGAKSRDFMSAGQENTSRISVALSTLEMNERHTSCEPSARRLLSSLVVPETRLESGFRAMLRGTR